MRHTLRVVVSGHSHQYLDFIEGGVRHVWMPSSEFILPDHIQPRVGEKLVGFGMFDFTDEGADFDLWCPNGRVHHDVSNQQAFEHSTAGCGPAD